MALRHLAAISRQFRSLQTSARAWSGAYVKKTEAETRMEQLLTEKLSPTRVVVEDQSGGCGAQYVVEIESSAFEGMTTLKQHRLVSSILKDEIANMHAIRIFTSPPKKA